MEVGVEQFVDPDDRMRIEARDLIDPHAGLAQVLRQRRVERRAAAVADEVDRQLRQRRKSRVPGQQKSRDHAGDRPSGKLAGAHARPVELDDHLPARGLAGVG